MSKTSTSLKTCSWLWSMRHRTLRRSYKTGWQQVSRQKTCSSCFTIFYVPSSSYTQQIFFTETSNQEIYWSTKIAKLKSLTLGWRVLCLRAYLARAPVTLREWEIQSWSTDKLVKLMTKAWKSGSAKNLLSNRKMYQIKREHFQAMLSPDGIEHQRFLLFRNSMIRPPTCGAWGVAYTNCLAAPSKPRRHSPWTTASFDMFYFAATVVSHCLLTLTTPKMMLFSLIVMTNFITTFNKLKRSPMKICRL